MRIFRYSAMAAALAVALLAGHASAQLPASLPVPGPFNLLDNGAFNISQRGTASIINITTVPKYLQDRWAVFSGTSTTASIKNVTTSLPAPFTNSVQVQRNNTVAAILPVCLVQEIPSNDVLGVAGQPVAMSAWIQAGANFSAASSNVTMKVTTGTVADEGLTSLLSGWTGAASTTFLQPITTSFNRYGWTTNIPAAALEIAVQICFTPVGTAGTADYFIATGIQFEQGTAPTAYQMRSDAQEWQRLLRYFWQINESATAIQVRGTCTSSTTSIANCYIPFPAQMRVAPTMTYTTGFEASATIASTSATVCTNLITSTTLTGNAPSQNGVLVDCASTAGFGAAGTGGFLWDIGTGSASGAIKASADF